MRAKKCNFWMYVNAVAESNVLNDLERGTVASCSQESDKNRASLAPLTLLRHTASKQWKMNEAKQS